MQLLIGRRTTQLQCLWWEILSGTSVREQIFGSAPSKWIRNDQILDRLLGIRSDSILLYSATTHSDIYLRAVAAGVEVKVFHNASIMNAIGCCGLQLYHFGQTVSIPLFLENWKPDSFYDKIELNKKQGLHTLCLLGKSPKADCIYFPYRHTYFPIFRAYCMWQISRSKSRTSRHYRLAAKLSMTRLDT